MLGPGELVRRNGNPPPEVIGFIWKSGDESPSASAVKTLGQIISTEPCHLNHSYNILSLDIGTLCLRTPTELFHKYTLPWQGAIPKDKLIISHIYTGAVLRIA